MLRERASKEFMGEFEVKSEKVCNSNTKIYAGKAKDWNDAIAAVVFEGEKSTWILRNVNENLGDACDLQIFPTKRTVFIVAEQRNPESRGVLSEADSTTQRGRSERRHG